MKSFSKNKKRGFTIIEALVSVLMLAVVIAAVSGLVQKSLQINSFSKEQIVANYLAGEAIEYVRNIRDANFKMSQPWLTGLDTCMGATCGVDANSSTIIPCTDPADCKLNFVEDAATGYYTHSAIGSPSNYTRSVYISAISPDEIAVVVTISGDRGLFSSVPLVVVEHMNNWY